MDEAGRAGTSSGVAPSRLRVQALLPYPLGRAPSQRYRIEQWTPWLEADGFEVATSSFLSPRGMDVLHGPGHVLLKVQETVRGYRRRLRERRQLASHQVIFLHREALPLAPALLERALLGRVPVVYDFDDAIYLRATSPGNRRLAWLKRPGKTAALCRLARHVTPGNDYLAEQVRREASRITVLPTTIDTERYVCTSRPANPRPVVGWTGSATTVGYLREIHAPLLELRSRVDFELRVVGARLDLPGLDVRCLPWRAETEVEDLRPLDVGVMPLPDDPWTRGKCGLKALQYMALAIPPVVSPVGVNGQIVTDGINGLHAARAEDWVRKLLLLLESPELRAALGSEARRTVEERYSARVHAPRLARVLRATAGQPG